MSRSLLRIAAGLALITCAGHTVGTFMAVPPEQVAMHKTIAIMKDTMIPMPVGAARSYMQVLDGNNICTAVFLLLSALLLFVVAGAPESKAVNRVALLTSLGLGAFAVISALYFFPVPTVFTAIAAVLGIIASCRSTASN